MPNTQSLPLIKIVVAMLVIGMLAVALTVGSYVWVFAPASSYSLSKSEGSWSNFGSYVGGLLGPAFAFLAFAAVLVTVWLQAKQLEHTQKQAQLEELQRVVAAVSKIVDDLLSQPAGPLDRASGANSIERTVFILLSAAGAAALSSTTNYVVTAANSTVMRLAKESLLLQASSLLIELQQLVWCLEEYELEGGSVTVVKFYRNRYNAVVCWLDALELAASSERVLRYFSPSESRQHLAGSV